MNKNLILIFISFSFFACSSGKHSENNSGTNIIKQKMTHKKFDIEAFDKNKNESGHWYFTDEQGYDIHQYSVTDGFVEYRKKSKDLFEEYYAFYSNGNLKEKKNVFINSGFNKGVGYFYDEQGNLTEEINYDIPYKYTWEQVYDFAVKHDIDLYDFHTLIQRYQDKERDYCWFITWRVPFAPEITTIILSGENGNILEEKKDFLEK